MNIAGKYAGTMYPIPRPLDPRDFIIEPDVGVWASQLLPLGVSIDQAIKEGMWPKQNPNIKQ
jgi:hypothetical protein